MTAPTRRTLLAIAVGATLLRFWGIGYGLPHPASRPDEDLVVGKALKISVGAMRDPRDFNYSHGVYYLHALALATWRGAGRLLGWYSNTEDFLVDVAVGHPALQYRICRASVALMGTATVLAVAWAAWEAYRRRSVALLAALLVAVNFLHARDSHFGTVDVPMTLFATLALGFALRAAGTQARRDYALSGLCAGLAASAKYNAATIAFATVVAAFPRLSGPHPRERRHAFGSLVLAGALMIVAFALTSPYCVLRLRDFLAGVAVQRHDLFDAAGTAAWHIHLTLTLPGAFGLLGFAVAVAGLIRSSWLRRPADLVLLAFMVPTFASLAEITWIQARYMLPLVPPLAILAAEATAAFIPAGEAWLAVASLCLALQPLWSTIAWDRLAARQDTRLLAADWVAEHVPPGSRIATCEGYGAPAINADDRLSPAFEPVRASCRTVDTIELARARYVITYTHPYIPFAASSRTLDWLRSHAQPRVVFDPFGKTGPRGMRHCFFQGDAFYLPYCRFGGVERGGPIVTIWDLGGAPAQSASE